MQNRLTVLLSIVALSGCAANGPQSQARGDDPVKISEGLYKLAGPGNSTESSGTAVKVRLLQQATAFCSSKGLAMAPGKSTTKDASAGARASADIQFRCVSVRT